MYLKKEIIQEIRKNRKLKQALQDLYQGHEGAKLSDSRLHDWLRNNDPRLTQMNALINIGVWTGKRLSEIVEGTEEELKGMRELILKYLEADR